MVNHLRFTLDLIRLRWNQPALRGDNVNPFHVHNSNRVIAFHRSDVYDNWVNPIVAGNGDRVFASGPPLHGFLVSASIVIPANGFVVFART